MSKVLIAWGPNRRLTEREVERFERAMIYAETMGYPVYDDGGDDEPEEDKE